MKTTVEMPDTLFAQLKKYASARHLTMREVIEISLRRTLDQERGGRKPFRLRNHTFKGKGQLVHDWKTIRQLIYEGRGG